MVEFQGKGSNNVASFVTSLSIVSLLISVMGNYELRYVSLWLRCGFAGHVCMWHLFYKSMPFTMLLGFCHWNTTVFCHFTHCFSVSVCILLTSQYQDACIRILIKAFSIHLILCCCCFPAFGVQELEFFPHMVCS